jgi:DNA-binding transcriptional LysR family regulator
MVAPVDRTAPDISAGRLVQVLGDWCPPFESYHLYYPRRKQHSAAFTAVIEALRHRLT